MTKVLLDTNILIYSINKKSKFHTNTKYFLESLIDNGNEIYIPDKSLYEFYRVLSSKIFVKRLGVDGAKQIWRAFAFNEFFKIIYSEQTVLKTTNKLLDKFPNNCIFDLQIMACGLVNKVDTIYTKNLKNFPENNKIKIVNPTI